MVATGPEWKKVNPQAVLDGVESVGKKLNGVTAWNSLIYIYTCSL